MNNSDEKRIWYYPKSGHGTAVSLQLIHHGRETALPCPLYHSGVAGIDIICSEAQPGNINRLALPPIPNSQFPIPNLL